MEFLDFNTIALIVGALLPMVISLVKSATWPAWRKRFVAIVVSAIATFATYLATQQAFDWNMIVADFSTIYVMAQVTYASFWKDSTVDNRLEQVGESMGKHAAP